MIPVVAWGSSISVLRRKVHSDGLWSVGGNKRAGRAGRGTAGQGGAWRGKAGSVTRYSAPAEEFTFQLRALGIAGATQEYRFHPRRQWRFDFAWPAQKVAVEVEGGTWIGGRHTRGSGGENDCEKYAEAMCLGWIVLRVTTRQVRQGKALAWLQKILGGKNAVPNQVNSD